MTPRKGDVPYIKVYNLTFNGGLDFSRDPTYISTDTHERILPRSKVFPGDVLMNIVGPPLGKVSIVPSTSPEWNMNQAIDVFRPVPSLDRSFLAFWLLSDQLLNWAVTRSKATAGQSNLTLQICRDLPIPLCSLEEQKEIVRDIESAFERIENLAAQAVRASDLLDRLDQATLDKVFRGEILVSDKESDEA
jgi:type I restriction enzyme S subunit